MNKVELFNVSESSLEGGVESQAYLKQYSLYLESLDKLSDRRQSANSFFLTLNAGLCTVFAFLLSEKGASEIKELYIIVPIVGFLLSYFWGKLVASYRQLSDGKFKIILRIEKFLPLSIYGAEWDLLGLGKDNSKYRPLTNTELWIPRLFGVMYIALFLYLLPWSQLLSLRAKLGI